jgi:hypothetical protein
MHHLSKLLGILATAGALLVNAASAQAAPRTFVSPSGNDNGACSFGAPCRTFQFAHDQTTAGGTMIVRGSANFGPLTITKSISIDAEGVEALILGASGGAAIIVQAPASAIVSLRGLTIDLFGTANIGIDFRTGGYLRVQDCQIRRGNFGINFASSTPNAELFVSNTTVADNSVDGIVVRPTEDSSYYKAALDRVNAENNGSSGIAFHSGPSVIWAAIRDSVAAGNTNVGIFLRWTTGNAILTTIDRTAIVNNGAGSGGSGIYAEGLNAVADIGDSTVSGNGTGLSPANSGRIRSFGTNKVTLNQADGAPTSYLATK